MRSWETRRGSGSVACLFDLIRNLASGRWTANCPQKGELSHDSVLLSQSRRQMSSLRMDSNQRSQSEK